MPLHIILSTPTGSGKTFSAVMMYLHLIKSVDESSESVGRGGAGETPKVPLKPHKGYPEVVVVFSVTTKQVRKT